MEFRFRADEVPHSSTYFSSSSSETYFTEQALRAGYISNDIFSNDFVRYPISVREEIQREIEKEMIREEIIAAEIARKRVLEAEVRRELLMERELVFGRVAQGFPASSMTLMRSEPRVTLIRNSDCGKMEERFPFATHQEVEKLPFQRNPEARNPEVKSLVPAAISKGPVMFLAKPMKSILAGTKRKAVAVASDLPVVGSKKKIEKEWGCALCQVSATSEHGLNEHLQGKKHKAKEAELRVNRTTSKNTGSSTSLPKITDKPTKLAMTNGNPNAKQVNKREGEQQKEKKLGDEPVQKRKKKFKLWCKTCRVGANSEIVMASHRRGKKHIARLEAVTATHGKAKKAAEEIAEDADGEIYGVEKIDEEVADAVVEMAKLEADGTEVPEEDPEGLEAIDSPAVVESTNVPIDKTD